VAREAGLSRRQTITAERRERSGELLKEQTITAPSFNMDYSKVPRGTQKNGGAPPGQEEGAPPTERWRQTAPSILQSRYMPIITSARYC
jgi:hypothetical protein